MSAKAIFATPRERARGVAPETFVPDDGQLSALGAGGRVLLSLNDNHQVLTPDEAQRFGRMLIEAGRQARLVG